MVLKFPHVRLQIYDSLVNQRLGCGGSIVKCATELGLVNAEQSAAFDLPAETVKCGSISAAEQVLRQCLSARGYGTAEEGKSAADRVWSDLKNAIEFYQRNHSLHMDSIASESQLASECSHITPIVMDYLLQKLQPYL